MRIFQLRICTETPNNGEQHSAYLYANICVYRSPFMHMRAYNKTQIQMAFYATCSRMQCWKDKQGIEIGTENGGTSKHVSHVFHYVRQTAWHERLITATLYTDSQSY